jgi:hypothetical protein
MNALRDRAVPRVAATALALGMSVEANARELDSHCHPSGVAVVKEMWDSKAFWTRQLKEIHDYVEGQKVAYRLSLIERKRARANEALDAEEMRTMCIPQISDPELEKKLRETDRYIAELDREMLQRAIAWGEKCTAYANQQLLKLK